MAVVVVVVGHRATHNNIYNKDQKFRNFNILKPTTVSTQRRELDW